MGNILTVASLTIREIQRRRFLTVALGLGVAFLVLYGLGFYFAYMDMVTHDQGFDLMLNSAFSMIIMAGLYAVSFLGIMAGVLVAVPVMAGEIASHTVDALAVRPFRRSTLVLGKWLGLAAVVTGYVGVLAGGVICITWIISGYIPPHALLGLALMVLEAIVLMTLTLAGGTRLSLVANGAMSLGLYGLAFIAGWMEEIGAVFGNQTLVDITVAVSLVVPSEAMWKMAAYQLQPPLVRDLGVSPFSVGAPPSDAMLFYTLIYIAGLLVLAVRAFEHRDL
ncbi:MAG: ABC transporter permease [Anaerolineae bacterium]